MGLIGNQHFGGWYRVIYPEKDKNGNNYRSQRFNRSTARDYASIHNGHVVRSELHPLMRLQAWWQRRKEARDGE